MSVLSSTRQQLSAYGAGSNMVTTYEDASLAERHGRPGPIGEINDMFTLGQNYPNPHLGETVIPFTLTEDAEIKLNLFDLKDRRMASIMRKELKAGEHTISLNLTGLGLPAGNYVYQLQVSNHHSVYRQHKTMTMA